MDDQVATGEVVSIEIEAVVIRADGTIEDLGVVSEWHKEEPDEEND